MKYIDINNKIVCKGDVIDLHQTVNGQHLFVVLNTEPLDIRYAFDLQYKYQYDKEELFKTEFEIVKNIYQFLLK